MVMFCGCYHPSGTGDGPLKVGGSLHQPQDGVAQGGLAGALPGAAVLLMPSHTHPCTLCAESVLAV